MKSFDRSIQKDGETEWITSPGFAEDHPEEYARARVVPWPEGAPDPSTVPQAGEQVTWRDGTVYNVVNGIPKRDSHNNTWCLWVKSNTNGVSLHPVVGDIKVYTPSPRSYTADEIEATYSRIDAYTAVDFLTELKRDHG